MGKGIHDRLFSDRPATRATSISGRVGTAVRRLGARRFHGDWLRRAGYLRYSVQTPHRRGNRRSSPECQWYQNPIVSRSRAKTRCQPHRNFLAEILDFLVLLGVIACVLRRSVLADRLGPAEVDNGWCEVVDALMIADMIVVRDEGPHLLFEQAPGSADMEAGKFGRKNAGF
jgi:hypothetical protein